MGREHLSDLTTSGTITLIVVPLPLNPNKGLQSLSTKLETISYIAVGDHHFRKSTCKCYQRAYERQSPTAPIEKTLNAVLPESCSAAMMILSRASRLRFC